MDGIEEGKVEDQLRQWPITDDLAALREHVHNYAVQAGLTGTRLDDVVIAANEAAINVLEHGGGSGTLTIWHDDDHLTIDIVDNAGRLRPDDVPRPRPDPHAPRGYGLWLIGLLCDTVSIEQAPGHSRVRLSMTLHPAPLLP
ncbi:hypothetical protein Mth01_40630 [Sphaerimonospora thailandensis]|uniref:Histidine kinase/HSP90-like ATPase domain-containing protein n=1 Tax=Sphaerimonospora thailandensis TaxID=795644 RepID=A0A8J3W140_9ACTN|nr:hypothetical protein Mth01_40630 [Sphaerimonospora thailandensis]